MSQTPEKIKSKKSRKDKSSSSSKKRNRSSIDLPSTSSSSSSSSSSPSKKKNSSKHHNELSSPRKSVKRIKKDDVSSTTKFKSPSVEKPLRQIIKQVDTPNRHSQQALKVSVTSSSSTTDPIVVSFPSGLPSSLMKQSSSRTVRFNDDNDHEGSDKIQSSPPPVFTWTKARKSSSRGRIIHGSDDTCTYISSNEGRGTDGRLTKFYIGVYHKPTNSLQLVPSSEKGTIFAMNQSVTSYNDSKSLDFRNMSVSERRRMVFETFGSQKKKKVLRSQQANIVEMKSVVGAGEGMMKALGKQMDNNMMSSSNVKVMEEMRGGDGGKKMMTAVEKAYAEARRTFLPPFDENATKPYQVYDSQEVAGDEAWDKISLIVKASLRKGDEWKEAIQGKRLWPESLRVMLGSVSDPAAKKGGVKYQLKTMLLVHFLVKFHNKASKKFMDGSHGEMAKFLGLPREVSDRFLALFCVPTHEKGRSGFATNKQLKDRRVVYTLVMYLLAHGREMKIGSIEKLCVDMQLEVKDAMNLYREAGCHCVKNKAGMVSVSLKVPLEFPPPKRGKKT